MSLDILRLILFQILLPATFIISLWRTVYLSKREWMIQGVFTVVFISWAFFSMPWDWFSYYLRFMWVLLVAGALIVTWKRVKPLPVRVELKRSQKWSLRFNVLLILVFGTYNLLLFSGFRTSDPAIQLDFPMKDGMYYVGQGGNHAMINYHNDYLSQQYALDIAELNVFGMRAKGIYPEELDTYIIYGDKLYSPCSGTIAEMRDDLPDQNPPKTDPENAPGNYVNILCEGVNVYIAHMQEGSVMVDTGDTVRKGQEIGIVGNSGNTTEPHLHIHAEKDGKGVPIEFDGRFLVRNSIVFGAES